MIAHTYSYEATLKDAYKVNWRVEDLIGDTKRLDFTKAFLPDSLAGVKTITCLNNTEKLILNQIRGNSYLHLFGLVEEFILPMLLDHVRRMGCDNIYETRALLCFAEEESKHIHLFRRFSEEFEREFETSCECIGQIKTIANIILQHHYLGVALMTLHIEWMTQLHYLDMVKDNRTEDLDPQFCSLLKHHWMEESQHAKLDTLLIEQLAQEISEHEIETGIADYLAIVKLFDAQLMTQIQLDLESLSRATGRIFTDSVKDEIQTVQEQSYRSVFLISGMTHPCFMRTLQELSESGQVRVAELAKAIS
ncbi:MAG: hypothetical protein HC769_20445 [Cyanobacteria bacterium CRU_2_1]|nr:hypothetical protein [Cyanobacteria bacterium CRU_2_1]